LLPIGRYYGEVLARLYSEAVFNNCKLVHRVDLRKVCAAKLTKTEQVAEAMLQYLGEQNPNVTQLSAKQVMDEAPNAVNLEITKRIT